MSDQSTKINTFKSLHQKGSPVILFNIWDAGSAAALNDSGAKALATGSAPVAMANGYKDGELIPLELALDNIARILHVTDLPVTMDLEGGYGVAPEVVESTIEQAMASGIVGFNFEDQIVGEKGLYDTSAQVDRVKAARKAADANGSKGFLNARTDIFLQAKPDTHSDIMVSEAIERCKAYEQAGADGFFAPGLADEALIGQLCESVNLPVNIIALPHVPPNDRLAELGVARISYGPVPYRNMIKWLKQSAEAVYS